jgi:hypothetical protein
MKSAFAVLAIVLSSLVFPQAASAGSNPPGCDNGRSQAQSCIATYYQPFSVVAFIPCLNQGKGENVTFSGPETTMFVYTVTSGKRNGFITSVGGQLRGTGSVTGIKYTAQGSTNDALLDWVPANLDGSKNGDGEFTYTDNYYIHSDSPVTNQVWHRTQRFEEFNNGLNAKFHPDEVGCK